MVEENTLNLLKWGFPITGVGHNHNYRKQGDEYEECVETRHFVLRDTAE